MSARIRCGGLSLTRAISTPVSATAREGVKTILTECGQRAAYCPNGLYKNSSSPLPLVLSPPHTPTRENMFGRGTASERFAAEGHFAPSMPPDLHAANLGDGQHQTTHLCYPWTMTLLGFSVWLRTPMKGQSSMQEPMHVDESHANHGHCTYPGQRNRQHQVH